MGFGVGARIQALWRTGERREVSRRSLESIVSEPGAFRRHHHTSITPDGLGFGVWGGPTLTPSNSAAAAGESSRLSRNSPQAPRAAGRTPAAAPRARSRFGVAVFGVCAARRFFSPPVSIVSHHPAAPRLSLVIIHHRQGSAARCGGVAVQELSCTARRDPHRCYPKLVCVSSRHARANCPVLVAMNGGRRKVSIRARLEESEAIKITRKRYLTQRSRAPLAAQNDDAARLSSTFQALYMLRDATWQRCGACMTRSQRRRGSARGGTPKRCGVGPGIVATSHDTSTWARDGSATHVGGRGRGPRRNGGT